MSDIIGLKEFRVNLPKYERLLKEGRSFTVVKRSRPAFRVVPPDPWEVLPVVDSTEEREVREAWETLLDFRKLMPDGKGIGAGHLIEILEEIKSEERKRDHASRQKISSKTAGAVA